MQQIDLYEPHGIDAKTALKNRLTAQSLDIATGLTRHFQHSSALTILSAQKTSQCALAGNGNHSHTELPTYLCPLQDTSNTSKFQRHFDPLLPHSAARTPQSCTHSDSDSDSNRSPVLTQTVGTPAGRLSQSCYAFGARRCCRGRTLAVSASCLFVRVASLAFFVPNSSNLVFFLKWLALKFCVWHFFRFWHFLAFYQA